MIEVNRKQFTRALDLASAVVGKSSTIPILQSMKVTANGALRLEATNLDNCTCAELPYEGAAGNFLLPQPRMLRSAINQAGGDDVSVLPADDRSIEVRSGRLGSKLLTMPVCDFPPLDRIGFEEFSATLGAAEFKQLARLVPAISQEETRYYLNGICVKRLDGWTYRFAATDGHKLMIVDIPLPDAVGIIPDNTIIPRDWLTIVLARLAKAKEGARLTFGRMAVPNNAGPDLPLAPGGPRIALQGDLDGIVYSVTGKLIDGQYPDYQRVVPTDTRYVVRVSRRELVQAISALASLSFDKSFRAVKLTFPAGKLRCELFNVELGTSTFDIDAEHNVAAGLEQIGFNAKYLLAMCNSLTGEEMQLHLSAHDAPAIVTDPADTAFKGVIMPMRV